MAKKKTVSVQLPADVLNQVDGDEQEELEEDEKDFLATLTEMKGAAELRWQLWRIKTANDPKPPGFVAELATDEMKMATVQERFGRGKYRVRGIGAGGTYVGGGTFEISHETPRTAAVVNQNGDVLALIQSMNEREEKKAEKSRDLMALAIPAAIAALPALIAAMKGGSSTDPIVMISALKQLQPTAPDNTALILKLIEMAGGKDGGDEPAWLGLAKQAATDLLPALANKLATPAQATPSPQPVPVQATSQPSPQLAATQSPEQQSMFALINWARETLAYLTKQAQKNSDPELYADWLIDNVPDGVEFMQFVSYIEQRNWFETLQQFAPTIAPYKEWFTDFRTALLEVVAKMKEEAHANAQDQAPLPDGIGGDSE